MHKRLIIVALAILLIASPVFAQSEISLKNFNVQLWSEHDQPSMLVIYVFEIADDAQIPTNLDIRLPREANITAVAFEADGGLLLAEYKTNPIEDENWQTITIFITEHTAYRVEYYQPLERNGAQRSFTFQWPGDYNVGNFDIEIQVPQDSTNVKTTPAIPFVQDQTYLSGGAMLNTLEKDETYQLKLEYSRSSNEPSLTSPSGQAVEPLVPVDANTEGRVTLDNLPYVLGGFGALLIVGAVVYFLRSGKPIKQQRQRQRQRRSKDTFSQIYCHECGTRAHEGDRFCRICGSRLRS